MNPWKEKKGQISCPPANHKAILEEVALPSITERYSQNITGLDLNYITTNRNLIFISVTTTIKKMYKSIINYNTHLLLDWPDWVVVCRWNTVLMKYTIYNIHYTYMSQIRPNIFWLWFHCIRILIPICHTPTESMFDALVFDSIQNDDVIKLITFEYMILLMILFHAETL